MAVCPEQITHVEPATGNTINRSILCTSSTTSILLTRASSFSSNKKNSSSTLLSAGAVQRVGRKEQGRALFSKMSINRVEKKRKEPVQINIHKCRYFFFIYYSGCVVFGCMATWPTQFPSIKFGQESQESSFAFVLRSISSPSTLAGQLDGWPTDVLDIYDQVLFPSTREGKHGRITSTQKSWLQQHDTAPFVGCLSFSLHF